MLNEARIWTIASTDHGDAVILKPVDLDVVVPIFIGQLEAQSILIGIGGLTMPRPNTHDLTVKLLESLDCTLTKIEISDIQDGIFYASLHLQDEVRSFIQESRPSDAIALAVRMGAPIYLSNTVVEEVGSPLSVVEGEHPLEENSKAKEVLELKMRLTEVILEENYEEAARIRDLLSSMGESPDPADLET